MSTTRGYDNDTRLQVFSGFPPILILFDVAIKFHHHRNE